MSKLVEQDFLDLIASAALSALSELGRWNSVSPLLTMFTNDEIIKIITILSSWYRTYMLDVLHGDIWS